MLNNNNKNNDEFSAPPRIDYDELVDRYHENLLTVLRGFNPGRDFLETWVPDADHHASILNLVESAHAAGLAALSVYVGPGTLRCIDLVRLESLIAPMGSVRPEAHGAGMLLEVRYA